MGKAEKNNPKPSLVESTVEAHRGCLLMVAEVEACLDRHPDTEGRWAEALREKLGELSERMREHFVFEEAGPIYRELPERHPRLATRLRRLESEHGAILSRIDEAVTRSERLDSGAQPYELRELNAHVQLLVATIERHESEENELVMEAHWNEVGVGD